MGLDCLDGLPNRFWSVLESFQPMVEVDATLADGVKRLILYTTGNHFVMKVVITHVTGSAMGVRYHHDFLHTKLIDSYNEAAHSRVEGRNHQASGILDNLCVTILQTQSSRKQLCQSSVHTREYREFLVGILTGQILLVALLFNELFVICNNLVYHKRNT